MLTGCLPSSCQREGNEALYPADSTSRDIAQSTPVDTLERLWSTQASDAEGAASLTHPRSVRFYDDGRLAVSDVERDGLFLFAPNGTLRQTVKEQDSMDVPYLAGVRKGSPGQRDTLVVFSAGTNRFDLFVDGRRLPGRSVSYERPAEETLVYAAASDASYFVKAIGQNMSGRVDRLNRKGDREAQRSLDGPYWRHAGGLRAWGDTLLSLAGFRPVIERMPLAFDASTSVDTTALVGFDSPMLERRYAFSQGDVERPPLLTPDAAPLGDSLYVLNLRPGWIRVDVYDRSGRLQHALVEPHEGGNPNFNAVGLDVRRDGEALLIAVALRSPEPALELFRWQPAGELAGR
jgi:hypothetical protein